MLGADLAHGGGGVSLAVEKQVCCCFRLVASNTVRRSRLSKERSGIHVDQGGTGQVRRRRGSFQGSAEQEAQDGLGIAAHHLLGKSAEHR